MHTSPADSSTDRTHFHQSPSRSHPESSLSLSLSPLFLKPTCYVTFSLSGAAPSPHHTNSHHAAQKRKERTNGGNGKGLLRVTYRRDGSPVHAVDHSVRSTNPPHPGHLPIHGVAGRQTPVAREEKGPQVQHSSSLFEEAGRVAVWNTYVGPRVAVCLSEERDRAVHPKDSANTVRRDF